MKCLNCEREIVQVGNRPKKFCSTKCRLAYFKKGTIEKKGARTIENDGKGTIERNDRETIEKPSYKVIANERVYNRQAVIYEHEKDGVINSKGGKWTTRPEPESPDDVPDKDNRCVYKRKNGTKYIIDAVGKIYPQE